MDSADRRIFPWGLTVAAVIAFAALIALGAWQLHRLAWKEALLARIEALRHAPARPLTEVLSAPAPVGAQGRAFTRVSTACAAPARASPTVFRYALRDGRVGWRLVTACHLTAGPYDGILLDRGLVTRFTGAMAPSAAVFPEPGAVTGVLRELGGKPLLGSEQAGAAGGPEAYRLLDAAAVARIAAQSGISHPAPYLLAVESEAPPAPGVLPAALPQDIPNNHFVYALTWFSLAGILAWFYLAMVVQRLRGR